MSPEIKGQALSDRALGAAQEATVAIFAFRGHHGCPIAWPVTPYVDGDRVVVTSTLAYVRKAEHIRRDSRVALLANGLHAKGRASVRSDINGDIFVSRLLPQELRKYPPARQLARIPFHRFLFSWYFGRVLMEFAPLESREIPGDDRWTLTTLDEDGFPQIMPIAEPRWRDSSFGVSVIEAGELSSVDGPATVLGHVEPKADMSDLRQLVLRGELSSGVFTVGSRSGTLKAAPPQSWLGRMRGLFAMRRRGRDARKVIRRW